jgi:TatD DNase family protein
MLHDTHAHLDLLLQKIGDLPSTWRLDQGDNVLDKISEIELDKAKVDTLLFQHDFIIHPTVVTDNFWLSYHLFHSFEKIFFLLGSHPEIVDEKFKLSKYLEDQRNIIIEMESNVEMSQKLVGIGEVGLDYHYTQNPEIVRKQIALFEEQIMLALKLKLPLVIHCREAFKDLFGLLKEYPEIQGNFLVHCFTEDTETLRQVLDYGGKIGIGGVVTFKSSPTLQEAVKYCPKENFVLETDLPFLAPVPHRGEICTPDMIDLVAHRVAEIRNEDVKDIWNCSLLNSRDLFGVFF